MNVMLCDDSETRVTLACSLASYERNTFIFFICAGHDETINHDGQLF